MKPRSLKITALICATLILFALTISSPPPAIADQGGLETAKIDPALLDAMRAKPSGEFAVIVQTQSPNTKKASARENSDRAEGAVNRIRANGGKRANRLAIIGAGSGTLNVKAIAALSHDPFVRHIVLDKTVKPLGTPGALSLYAQIVRAPEVWAQGFNGQGVGIAILDSGIAPVDDLALPASRIVASVDFASTTATPDPGGHGTHVAGIAAGNGADSAQARMGIAPSANLVSVRVIDSNGIATLSSVIRGIQWVVQNRKTYNIRVMNLSLGAPSSLSYRMDPLAAAAEMAWFSGIVVTAAAGNAGPAVGTVVTPGIDPYLITVGALDDAETLTTSDDAIAFFSSHGPTLDGFSKPDLVAPGRKTVSLRVPGSYLDLLLPDRITDINYFRLSGTSMSAPVVAGTAALMFQKHPGMKSNHVKNLLLRTAHPLASTLDVNSAGAGLVDAYLAVNSDPESQANRGLTPSDAFCISVRPLLQGMPLSTVWRDPSYKGINWLNIGWDNISWDRTTWENIAWENISWDNITWTNIGWDNISWDPAMWDSTSTGAANSAAWSALNSLD